MPDPHDARPQSEELLRFRLKLTDARVKKRAFISAGKPEMKRQLLPSVRDLHGLGVEIFATEGTSRFLAENGVPSTLVRKINERTNTDVRSMLLAGMFDIVVNILTGDVAYDERSDAKIIRELAHANGIPLITDTFGAAVLINQLVEQVKQTKLVKEADEFDMPHYFAELVADRGGWANYHAHADKAYTMTAKSLQLGQMDMQKKWELYGQIKQGELYTPEGLRRRIERVVREQIEQGVTYFRTHVDADTSIRLEALEAALEVKRQFADQIVMEIGTQPLEGVLDPAAWRWYSEASARADLLGGLPSKDRKTSDGPEKHLDRILALGKELGKRVDVHVDQENNPDEDETELLARAVIRWGMEGRVSAIHAISVAAKPKAKRQEIYRCSKDAGLSIIVCPSAALSMKPHDKMAPIHNSIAPVQEMRDAGLQVVLGVDNISDFFMPFVDGSMWQEVRQLMESCRWYDAESIADLACDKSLFVQQMPKAA